MRRPAYEGTRQETGLKTGHYNGGRAENEKSGRQAAANWKLPHSYPGRTVAREVYLVKRFRERCKPCELTGIGAPRPKRSRTARRFVKGESINWLPKKGAAVLRPYKDKKMREGLGLPAVDGGVADVLALDDVDDVLGDVGGVIADAFEIFRHEDKLERGKDHAGIAHHVGK